MLFVSNYMIHKLTNFEKQSIILILRTNGMQDSSQKYNTNKLSFATFKYNFWIWTQ